MRRGSGRSPSRSNSISFLAATFYLGASLKRRLQKEVKVALILLLTALGSLAIANCMFEGSTGQKGSVVTLDGNVTEVKETAKGSNLMIHVDTSDLTIFMPESS
jgi:hypothetical protein